MDQAERDRKDRKDREERERRVREKEEERKEREAERERREKEKEERAKRAEEELLMQEDSSSQSLLYLGREAIPKKIISLEQHTNLYCSKLGIVISIKFL